MSVIPSHKVTTNTHSLGMASWFRKECTTIVKSPRKTMAHMHPAPPKSIGLFCPLLSTTKLLSYLSAYINIYIYVWHAPLPVTVNRKGGLPPLINAMIWGFSQGLANKKSMLGHVLMTSGQILLPPEKLTWNGKSQGMKVWKMMFLFNRVIFEFHVKFQGCISVCCHASSTSLVARRFCMPQQVPPKKQSQPIAA